MEPKSTWRFHLRRQLLAAQGIVLDGDMASLASGWGR